MSGRGYIVPNEMLKTNPPLDQWHATTLESDPSKSLVVVVWDNPNYEVEFEARPEVLVLGDPWEPMPAEAQALLSPAVDISLDTSLDVSTLVTPEPQVAPESVSSVLRKTNWPGARLIR